MDFQRVTLFNRQSLLMFLLTQLFGVKKSLDQFYLFVHSKLNKKQLQKRIIPNMDLLLLFFQRILNVLNVLLVYSVVELFGLIVHNHVSVNLLGVALRRVVLEGILVFMVWISIW